MALTSEALWDKNKQEMKALVQRLAAHTLKALVEVGR
jgi:hypothetical protein